MYTEITYFASAVHQLCSVHLVERSVKFCIDPNLDHSHYSLRSQDQSEDSISAVVFA